MSNGPDATPASTLVLGSAQFGMRYGIVNDLGVPDDAELRAILETAAAAGIAWIDTARGYGDAEERLGALTAIRSYRIVTKIAPLDGLNGDAGAATLRSLDNSLAALRTDRIDVVMLHRSADAERPGVLDALVMAKAHGRISAIGVSVYTPDEAAQWLADQRITHLQLPCNVLDHRWQQPTFLTAWRARTDVVVHARSAFLQGLLLAPASAWPEWVTSAQAIVDALDRAAAPLAGGRAELCLRYHRNLRWIDATVIGIASREQLRKIIEAASGCPLDTASLEAVTEAASLVPARLLDPRLW